tara:strand:- start:2115 stop:2288 length:174 start_codon:yes stop_codon:yes gene_type:complete
MEHGGEQLREIDIEARREADGRAFQVNETHPVSGDQFERPGLLLRQMNFVIVVDDLT